MWHWRQNQLKRISFFSKLLVLSGCMHLLLVFMLMFLYRGSTPMHVDVSAQSMNPAKVVFVPLHKSLRVISRGKNLQAQGAAAKQQNKLAAKKSVVKPAVAKMPKRTALAVVKPPKKQSKKVAFNEKKSKTKSAKAEKKKIEVAQKKSEPAEPEIKPEKKQVAKTTEPEAPEVKPEKQQVAQVPEQIVTAVDIAESEVLLNIKTADGNSASAELDDVLYVGRDEMEALEMQTLIQAEVEKHWSCPVGLANDLMCDVRVLVDWDGTAKEVEVIKTSQILMYDIQARSAVLAMTFPESARGKEIIVHFQ